MRTAVFVFAIAIAAPAAEPAAESLVRELSARRGRLASLHQEFDYSRTSESAGRRHVFNQQITVDMAAGKWRQQTGVGDGAAIQMFDGVAAFDFEAGGDSFVRHKHRAKDPAPQPTPYCLGEPVWAKGVVVDRKPCGIPGTGGCVIVQAPLKPWAKPMVGGGGVLRMPQGVVRAVLDENTGILVAAHIVERIESPRHVELVERRLTLQRLAHGNPPDLALFTPPAGLEEVKKLPEWNASRIRKNLVGKPAPALSLTDRDGKPFNLADLKGNIVLIDFWASWCPPCRVDAPAMQKLHSDFGGRGLAVVGIANGEDRATVDAYLAKTKQTFPVILSAENEMPRPYRVAVLPTYLVIDSDGVVQSVAEGDQGFSALRKMLRNAGLPVE